MGVPHRDSRMRHISRLIWIGSDLVRQVRAQDLDPNETLVGPSSLAHAIRRYRDREGCVSEGKSTSDLVMNGQLANI